MNLPKYTPGYVVVYRKELDDNTTEEGMFAISGGFLEHEQWHYENHDRSLQIHEHEIIGLLANGLFIPNERVTGVQHAPEYDPEAANAEQLAGELDEDEKAFIKEHEGDRDPKQIDFTDESTGEQKVDVKGGNQEG